MAKEPCCNLDMVTCKLSYCNSGVYNKVHLLIMLIGASGSGRSILNAKRSPFHEKERKGVSILRLLLYGDYLVILMIILQIKAIYHVFPYSPYLEMSNIECWIGFLREMVVTIKCVKDCFNFEKGLTFFLKKSFLGQGFTPS